MAQSISFQEAAALAKSGNAEAQYALSSVLHQRGQFDESLHWLRLAAAQKLIPAQITLAVLLMDGRQGPRDRQQAIDLLQPLAATQIQANLLLGELHGFAALGIADRETGLRYLLAAARMGDAGRCANWLYSASAINAGICCVRCWTHRRGVAMPPPSMPLLAAMPGGSAARRNRR